MPLTPGTRLGPYEIVSAIGAGGMGEVYRARDAKLNRDVALKVLPDLLATDPDRLARFRREAQVLAALNHPNIAHIYGFEDSGATHAIVMELVEGPTLADRIARSAIPLAEALPIARQIADALEAAHEQGIVHRDLKPANVKVRDDGAVKVLDFGLAKALDPNPSSAAAETVNSPTMTARATQMGMILGTAAYMAPEQARGRAVDKRADVWAFGVVLYEMLTGARAFGGDDIAETLASVLKDTPSLGALPPATPVRLRRLLERCLERDVKQRLRDIGEARIEIAKVEAGATDESASSPAVAVRAPRSLVPWVLLAAVSIALVAILLRWPPWRSAPPIAREVSRSEYRVPEDQQFTHVARHVLAISPDGTKIAYVANHRLYLKPADQLKAAPIRGTDEDPWEPAFSPDGQWLAYFRAPSGTETDTGIILRKIPVEGGVPVTLCHTATLPFGMSWRNGTIAFGQNSQTLSTIQSVPDIGGSPRTLVSIDPAEGRAIRPQLLDDGQHVLFTVMPRTGTGGDAQVVVQAFDGSPRKVLLAGVAEAQVLSSGQLVYVHETALLAVSFDAKRLEVVGGPVSIFDGVTLGGPIGTPQYVVSRQGTLAYWPGRSSDARCVMVWVNRQGKEEAIAAPPRAYEYPRLSPDERSIAVASTDAEHGIWIWDLLKETLTPLTSGSATATSPIWMPDRNSRQVVFRSADGGRADILRKASDGPGVAEALTTDGTGGEPESISPNGKLLVYLRRAQLSSLMLLPLDGSGPSRELLVDATLNQSNAAVSPDGQWIAYESNKTKTAEVYVRPFPAVSGREWMVSVGGGSRPVWARSGRELLYVEGGQGTRLMTVAIQPGAAFNYGKPQVWLDMGRYSLGKRNARWYDVASDGRVLALKSVGDETLTRDAIVTVTHWFDEVAARVK